MPVLSIIIPVYNAEKTLRNCIDSILIQKNSNFEIILVDDGSTDSSGELCDQFHREDDRIKVIHQNNRGASAARNSGLDYSSGKWVTFIDADDVIEGDYIINNFESEWDMYVQNLVFTGGTKEAQCLERRVISYNEMMPFWQKYSHWDLFRSSYCKFIKKDILDNNNIRFDNRIKLGEDAIFFMEYISFCRQIYIMGTGNYLYYRPETWSDKYQLSLQEALYFFKAFLKRYDLLPSAIPNLATFQYGFISSLLKAKDKKTVSWKLSPYVIRLKEISFPSAPIWYRIRLIIMKILSFLFRFK